MNAKIQSKLAEQEGQRQSFSKLPIERRHVKFSYKDIDKFDFYNNNAVISAYWAGLSATFPRGEAEFINSVKLFEDQITDPKLKAEVADFAAQEAHHSLQHKLVNKQFTSLGYRIEHIESEIDKKIAERVASWSNEKRLMRTVCAEHVTAVMAHHILEYPDVFNPSPESLKNLLQWHAIEEIEHKSVAFDVYMHCVGDIGKLKRHYIWFTFFEFPMSVYAITKYLIRKLGHTSSRQERKEMRQFLFGKEGSIRSMWSLYTQFLKKGFHPWSHDDSALATQYKLELEPYFRTS